MQLRKTTTTSPHSTIFSIKIKHVRKRNNKKRKVSIPDISTDEGLPRGVISKLGEHKDLVDIQKKGRGRYTKVGRERHNNTKQQSNKI